MKAFLFSRRFLIPFLITWAGHLTYILWELQGLYKDDFKGKGLPSSLLFKWLWHQASAVISLSFLLAFVIGMTWYSHYKMRKDKTGFKPFSPVNLLLLVVIALAGFLYTSFDEPGNNLKSGQMLSAVVFAKSYADFRLEIKRPFEGVKSERMMTLPELLKQKDSLQKETGNDNVKDFDKPVKLHPLQKVKWEIARKYALPFSIVMFYITGVFMGMSFYRLHIIIPVLISWILVFAGWYYGTKYFEFLFRAGRINAGWGVYGPVVLFYILLGCWWLGLRNYGAFNKQEEEWLPDFGFDNEEEERS